MKSRCGKDEIGEKIRIILYSTPKQGGAFPLLEAFEAMDIPGDGKEFINSLCGSLQGKGLWWIDLSSFFDARIHGSLSTSFQHGAGRRGNRNVYRMHVISFLGNERGMEKKVNK